MGLMSLALRVFGGPAGPDPEEVAMMESVAAAGRAWAERARLDEERELQRKAAAALHSRDYRRRNHPRRRQVNPPQCKNCPEMLIGRRSDAKLCSDLCRVSWHRGQAAGIRVSPSALAE